MNDTRSEGARIWLIADGFIPETSLGAIESHETISFLNTSNQDARVNISFYFADRDPLRNAMLVIPAERTKHVRTANADALGGVVVPNGIPYAMRIESDIPVSVQHSRMDGRQEAMGLMTTMAYPVDERNR